MYSLVVEVIFKTLEEPQSAQTTRPGDLPESRVTPAGRVNICSEVYRHTSGSLSPALSKWLTHLSLFFQLALFSQRKTGKGLHLFRISTPSEIRRVLLLVQLCFSRRQHVDSNESLECSHPNWAKWRTGDEDASSQSS